MPWHAKPAPLGWLPSQCPAVADLIARPSYPGQSYLEGIGCEQVRRRR